MKTRILAMLILLGGLTSLSGCATSRDGDPLEGANRAILSFNLAVDRVALKPVAKGYAKLPESARNHFGNFFANLATPYTILNDLLQGKFAHAGRDTGRFLLNTSIGFFGIADPAQGLGFPARREDFGQTLAVWGVPPGPYLMLPFFGPSGLRDVVGLGPQYITDPVTYVDPPDSYYATGLRLVDARADLLGTDELLALQPDQYLFLREGYRQLRRQRIYDGNPPEATDGTSEDDLLDELLEDE